MSTTLDSPARSRCVVLDGATIVALVGAAVAFNLGGALHPNGSGTGGKVAQLHDMLLRSSWYPSHLGLLVSFGLFTVFSVRLKDGRGFSARAAAADFADIHAAQVAAASAERAHPADGVIERYLSGRDKPPLPEQTNADAEPLSPALPSPAPLPATPVPSSPKARPLPRPPAVFGKRGR